MVMARCHYFVSIRRGATPCGLFVYLWCICASWEWHSKQARDKCCEWDAYDNDRDGCTAHISIRHPEGKEAIHVAGSETIRKYGSGFRCCWSEFTAILVAVRCLIQRCEG